MVAVLPVKVTGLPVKVMDLLVKVMDLLVKVTDLLATPAAATTNNTKRVLPYLVYVSRVCVLFLAFNAPQLIHYRLCPRLRKLDPTSSLQTSSRPNYFIKLSHPPSPTSQLPMQTFTRIY